MILLCGLPAEAPLALVASELADRKVPVAFFDQRHSGASSLTFDVTDDGLTGELTLPAARVRLDDIDGVYLRLQDDRKFPDVRAAGPGSAYAEQVRSLHAAFIEWTEMTSALVVSRFSRQASNGSKPYQAQIINACGFAVPPTLITNEPERVLDFRQRHGRVVYKSVSGIRSVVTELTEPDLRRLGQITWCPVQFQKLVPGTDVRVHVVGEQVFPTRISSDAVDYRYAARQDHPAAELSPTTLAPEVAARCVDLARRLELPFAGLDLRMGDDGQTYCFEANPSPAFSYYQHHTGQPIAAALADLFERGGT